MDKIGWKLINKSRPYLYYWIVIDYSFSTYTVQSYRKSTNRPFGDTFFISSKGIEESGNYWWEPPESTSNTINEINWI